MRSILRSPLGLAALLSLGASASTSQQQSACDEGTMRGHLGIEISCDCTVSRSPAGRPWSFRSPIIVRSVEATGPAAGVLQAGDSIVAIGGISVTVPEGASRLAGVAPGEQVRLTIRRDGGVREVTIVPSAICPGDARAIGSYAPSPLGLEGPAAADVYGGRGASEAAGPVPTLPDLQPEGWLGFGLACRRCGWAREAGDAAPYWESAEPPVVYGIEPGSPAAAADLRAGDLLTHVNGAPITSRAGGRALGGTRPGDLVRLTVEREAREREIELTARQRPAATAPPAVQYAGRVGDVLVEVSGPRAVAPSLDVATGRVTLRVDGTTVRLTPTQR